MGTRSNSEKMSDGGAPSSTETARSASLKAKG